MPSFNPRQFFQYVSYLQYPLLLVGFYYLISTMYVELTQALQEELSSDERLDAIIAAIAPGLNITLMFFGIALSASTLQDPTKSQNKLSLNVWRDPKKGKIMLIYMAVTAAVLILCGLAGLLLLPDTIVNELSFGILTIGIAYVGMLRVAIEMFSFHRTDTP